MNSHGANIESLKPQFLYKHFTSDGHKFKGMFVQHIKNIVLTLDEYEELKTYIHLT